MSGCGERIILVMRQPGNVRVLTRAVAELGLSGVGVSTESELDAALAEGDPPRSALVDVSGFGSSVWIMCNALQARGVPFVVLSPAVDAATSGRSLRHGAASVLQKPVAKSALLQLVQTLGDADQ